MSKSLQWDSLDYTLQPWIKTAIDVMGFDQMTPVQASTIPMFAGNKDVVVDSVTGSGKTVSFVIPILEKIISENCNNGKFKKGHFHSLVISPTRELARQIQSVIDAFLAHYPEDLPPIRSQLLVGTDTASVRDDVNKFLDERPLILVGTPGRVLDFFQMPVVKTTSCSMVILDEADRLLDVSFVGDVEKILGILPKQRRTGLFSATIASAGNTIFKAGLRNPVKIKVNSKTNAPASLTLNYCVVDPQNKLQHLVNIINDYRFKKCIVYFPTSAAVNYFYMYLHHLQKEKNMIDDDAEIFSLHGKLQTSSRTKTLEKFTDSLNKAVLITTDVAARGIDIPDVDLVIQMDPPNDTDLFMHRCGRTGRANKIGKAITFINRGREEDFIPFMEVKNVALEEDKSILKPISQKSVDSFYNTFRKWILEDRARFEIAVKAYVAYIRFYSNHSAISIFRLQTFDFVGLCKSYGLFRLPKMPEITKHFKDIDAETGKQITYGDGWLIDPPIDMNKFKFADPKREKNRLAELEKLAAINDKKKLKAELKKKNMAWSDKTMTKESKLKRREKMSLKRKAIEAELAKNQDGDSSDSDNDELSKDWKEEIMESKRRKNNSSGMQGSFDDL